MVTNCKNCGSNQIKNNQCQHCGTIYSSPKSHITRFYSGSGSGSYSMKPYFIESENGILEWGSTCEHGYIIEISPYKSFDKESVITRFQTEAHSLDTRGWMRSTYFARIANRTADTDFSPIYTFEI